MPTYIRVKDLPNAATSPASDDFILLSGTANGARRISRADFLSAVAGFYTADPSTYKLATLDAGDKVLVSQLPSAAFSYKGTWAASSNTPSLANGTGTGGDTYYASDSGSVNFGAGSISFLAGDAVVYDGTIWQKVPDVVNLLDGKGTLDEAKTTLEIPDVGTAPNEVPLNGMLGDMAYQSSEGISVGTATIDGDAEIGATSTDHTRLTISSPNNKDGQISFDDTDGSLRGFVVYDHAQEKLKIGSGGANAVYVDSSQRVGIGTASLGSYNYGADDLVIGDGTGVRGLTIASANNLSGRIFFADPDSPTSGQVRYDHSTDKLSFATGGADRWSINSTGNLVAGSGLGIDFGSVAGGTGTPAANGGLLDDYERGTATPTDASGAGLTLAVVGCNYIKIGSQVTAWVQLTYPTTSDTSTATVGGFPFAFGASDIDRIGGFVVYQNTGLDIAVLGTNSAAEVTFRNNSGTSYSNAQMSGKIIWFCVTYDVS